MKQHIILKLRENAPEVNAAHWCEVIHDKSLAATTIHPEVDRVLAHFKLPVWITREYQPQQDKWSAEAIASGLNRVYRLILQNSSQIPPSLIRQISLLPIVEQVRGGQIAVTDMPGLELSQAQRMTGEQAREAIYLDEAHQFTTGDPEITVAVLDTGISSSHPELRDRLVPGYDFVDIIDGASKFIGDYLGFDEDPEDEVGHGTHVAGIIAAKGLAMPVGVIPRCRILPVRVLGAMKRGEKRIGAGLVDNINPGIQWAIDQGADVINMSLGIKHTGGGLPHEEVVQYAQHKGVTIVAASGNDGTEDLYYPGALPHVITVGAYDQHGEVASFSNYGEQVDFIAPGVNIYSTYLNNEYAFSSGTSHASPFVAGGVALLKSYARSKGKNLTDRQVKYILKHTADKVDARFKHHKAGFGRLNLVDALRLLEEKLK